MLVHIYIISIYALEYTEEYKLNFNKILNTHGKLNYYVPINSFSSVS